MHGCRSDGADGRGGHLRLIIVAVSQAFIIGVVRLMKLLLVQDAW